MCCARSVNLSHYPRSTLAATSTTIGHRHHRPSSSSSSASSPYDDKTVCAPAVPFKLLSRVREVLHIIDFPVIIATQNHSPIDDALLLLLAPPYVNIPIAGVAGAHKQSAHYYRETSSFVCLFVCVALLTRSKDNDDDDKQAKR